MRPTNFPGTNRVLTKPENWNEAEHGPCDDLPVMSVVDEAAGLMHHSGWRPSAEELAQLNAGHVVILTVFGSSHPPVGVSVSLIPVLEKSDEQAPDSQSGDGAAQDQPSR